MICNQCKREVEEKDFFGKEACYKCVYKYKVKIAKEIKNCKVCSELLPKGKWTYCSEGCAYVGKNMHNRNYWINTCKSQKVRWKH